MRIVVCGDSFCSKDPAAPGKHFSELLDAEVINLARGGISNSAIFMQLHKALHTYDPDVIIYSETDPARMTIPVSDVPFNPGNPLDNIRYDNADTTRHFVSHTIPSILGELDLGLEKHTVSAVKDYFNVLYDPEMQSFLDHEMFKGYVARAQRLGIQTVCLNTDVPDVYKEAWELNDNPVDWVFHTSFECQERAAEIIKGILNYGN